MYLALVGATAAATGAGDFPHQIFVSENSLAEGERFELSDDVTAVNGFRDRPVQPLRHPSKR